MMDCGSTILIFIALIQATCGQNVDLAGPSAIENGSDTVYTYTGGAAPFVFTWEDLSVGTGVNIFIAGQAVYDPLTSPKYVNFEVSENGDTSTMTIFNTLIEDEGRYGCSRGTGGEDAELKVEVNSTKSLSVQSTIESSIDMYVATCEALEGRPEATITWMLGDGALSCDSLVETNPTAKQDLSSTRSVCTFQATSENNGETLECVITGHLVSELNGEKTFTLPMHSAPGADIITVGIQILGNSSVRVLCNISEADQPNPRIRNYYIYSKTTLIHQSSTGGNFVDVPESDYDLSIVFNCVAGNYLGNTTTFPPVSTTTLTPTTTAETQGLPAGAIAGIAIGCIFCIVIIVVIVLYFLRPECCPCFAGSG